MVKLLPNFNKKAALRLATLTGLGLSLSGCVYDYGGDGYYAEGYGADQCDPYSEFDSYYDCDNRLGFVNIGFGGGWYDNYYYPGHGFYLFDSYGSRYNMHDRYRRYWAQQRYHHYQNYARGGHGRGYGRGHGQGYGNGHGQGYGNGHGQGYGQGYGQGGYRGDHGQYRDHGQRRRGNFSGVAEAVRDVAGAQERRDGGERQGRGRRGGQVDNNGAGAAVRSQTYSPPPAPAAVREAPAARPQPAPAAQRPSAGSRLREIIQNRRNNQQ